MAKIKVAESDRRTRWRRDDRIIWSFLKNKLILPYLDVDLKYYVRQEAGAIQPVEVRSR